MIMAGSSALLWWNEGRAVRQERMLRDALRNVTSIDGSVPPPAELEGELVHVSGEVESGGVADPLWPVQRPGAVFDLIERRQLFGAARAAVPRRVRRQPAADFGAPERSRLVQRQWARVWRQSRELGGRQRAWHKFRAALWVDRDVRTAYRGKRIPKC